MQRRYPLLLIILVATFFSFSFVYLSVAEAADCSTDVATDDELNAAIVCYNAESSGVHILNITQSFTLDAATEIISNTHGAQLQIDGNGFTIDGDDSYRPFTIYSSSRVTIDNLTIQNGNNSGSPCPDVFSVFTPGCAGGIAIRGTSLLTLLNSTVMSNSVGAVSGGGLSVQIAGVVIRNSLFAGNTTLTNGAAIYNDDGTVIIHDSLFTGNDADIGGAIYHAGGGLAVLNSTIHHNVAETAGGIFSEGASLVNIYNSTISHNSAERIGGIQIAEGGLTMINSTVAFNSHDPGEGSALAISLSEGSVNLTIYNSIFANNEGGINCGIVNFLDQHTFDMGETNLSDDDSCLQSTVANHMGLDSLQDNGGSLAGVGQEALLTHALLPSSPAINAGDNANCADASINNLDQNGITRPQYATCDVGAVEFEFSEQPFVTIPITQTIYENHTALPAVTGLDDEDTVGNGLTLSMAGADAHHFSFDAGTGRACLFDRTRL